MSKLQLLAGGQAFEGFDQISIALSMQQLANSFELQLTDKWSYTDQPRSLPPGTSCSIKIGDETVITGFVNDSRPSYTKEHSALSVSGRDAAGDLVDCAAVFKAGQWKDQTLATIAKDLCGPFGIKVKIETDVGKPFSLWKIEPGETVFENLERASRFRGVLLLSDGLGNLLITKAGAAGNAPAGLVYGENIIAAEGGASDRERFSEYIVRAQSMGTDDTWGAGAAGNQATAKDSLIKRYRPTIILAEDQGNNASLQLRANWQRNINAGRGQPVTYTVQGWDVDGKLWRPNTTVPINDPKMELKGTRLIVSAEFTIGDQGSMTKLTVMPKEAFDTIAIPETAQWSS